MTHSIMIVEDEPAIRDMLKFVLHSQGFSVNCCEDVQAAKQSIKLTPPDLILLDWMLPGTSGIEYAKVLKQASETQNIPIIMLTAKAEEENKILGLEVGADDYITKPFSPRELVARIRAVLRRGPLQAEHKVMRWREMTVDVAKHQVKIAEQTVALTPMLFRLLVFLMDKPGRVFNREQLLNAVWQDEPDVYERTVDVHVRRLRQALEQYGYQEAIKTIHGLGYGFNDDDANKENN